MNNWEKEFNEKFDRKIVYFDGLNHNHHIFGTMGLAKDIKQFIQEQIKKALLQEYHIMYTAINIVNREYLKDKIKELERK